MLNSRVQPLPKSDIYLIKKNKEPDHLFNLLCKMKNTPENDEAEVEQKQKDIIKKKIMQKRIDAILKNGTSQVKVSDPVPFIKKKWFSPLSQLSQNIDFDPFKDKKIEKVKMKMEQTFEVQRVVNILDINKKLKYFGQYLQVELNSEDKVQVANISGQQQKVAYLAKKFQQLQKQLKPKLCIANFQKQQKITFINFLEPDQFYQNIIRNKDEELMRMLIVALESQGKFTLTSYMTFYSIFVWQSADRRQQIDFVAKLLMGNSKEMSIVQVSKIIDIVCRKIYIQNFNKSLQNFNEVMKKLLFGDDYEYSCRKQYYLTRKALVESLQRNQQCISIFINIFYSG